MNKDEIIRMAREAGAVFPLSGSWHRFDLPELLAFANLVAEREREECAKLCMEINPSPPLSNRVGWEHGTIDCNAAIRERTAK